MHKIPTGSKILDKMLEGGYEKDIITTIYGPAGSGKTVLCMLCSASIARDNKKIVYIDTEGGFSVERLKQVAPDFDKVLENIVFLKPTNFSEQNSSFEKLANLVDENIGLIVVDTIAMLYRLELGKSSNVYDINRELGKQISYLIKIAREKNIPIILTNQVYANFEEKSDVKIVGGDLLKYQSKCLIELQSLASGNRAAILRKHRSLPEERTIFFKIVEGGIIGTKEN